MCGAKESLIKMIPNSLRVVSGIGMLFRFMVFCACFYLVYGVNLFILNVLLLFIDVVSRYGKPLLLAQIIPIPIKLSRNG